MRQGAEAVASQHAGGEGGEGGRGGGGGEMARHDVEVRDQHEGGVVVSVAPEPSVGHQAVDSQECISLGWRQTSAASSRGRKGANIGLAYEEEEPED